MLVQDLLLDDKIAWESRRAQAPRISTTDTYMVPINDSATTTHASQTNMPSRTSVLPVPARTDEGVLCSGVQRCPMSMPRPSQENASEKDAVSRLLNDLANGRLLISQPTHDMSSYRISFGILSTLLRTSPQYQVQAKEGGVRKTSVSFWRIVGFYVLLLMSFLWLLGALWNG